MMYRCTTKRCRQRVKVSSKRHASYNPGRCAYCGGRLALDHWQRRWNKNNVCRCDGLHHPHRKETDGCIHGDVDPRDYYRRLSGY